MEEPLTGGEEGYPLAGGQPPSRRRGGLVWLLLVVAIALLVVNIVLMVRQQKLKREAQQSAAQLESITLLKEQLQQELQQAYADLEMWKGRSATLDSMVREYESKLEHYRRLLASRNVTIEQLRKELSALRQERQVMLARIDSMAKVIEQLQVEKAELQERLSDEERRRLQAERDRQILEEKIKRSSVFRAVNIDVAGLNRKRGDKLVRTDRVNRIDELMVCFDVIKNPIIEPGVKVAYLRLVGPDGSVLTNQELGSGTFVEKGTGEKKEYTTQLAFEYTALKDEHLCMSWKQPEWLPGDYRAEIYIEGELAGFATFTLRKPAIAL